MKSEEKRTVCRRNDIIAQTRTHHAANQLKGLKTAATTDHTTEDRIHGRHEIVTGHVLLEIDPDLRIVIIEIGNSIDPKSSLGLTF